MILKTIISQASLIYLLFIFTQLQYVNIKLVLCHTYNSSAWQIESGVRRSFRSSSAREQVWGQPGPGDFVLLQASHHGQRSRYPVFTGSAVTWIQFCPLKAVLVVSEPVSLSEYLFTPGLYMLKKVGCAYFMESPISWILLDTFSEKGFFFFLFVFLTESWVAQAGLEYLDLQSSTSKC